MLTEKKAAKDGAMNADTHGQTDLHPGGDRDQTRYSDHGQIPAVEPLREAAAQPSASERAYGEVGRPKAKKGEKAEGDEDSYGPMGDRFRGDDVLGDVDLNIKTLKLGDKGTSIRKVQQALFDLSYGPITVNGTFDQATFDCVKRFQSDHKTKLQDGTIDQNTFEQIEREFFQLDVYARAAHHGPPGMQHTPFKTDAKDVPVHLAETRDLDDEDRTEIDAVLSDNHAHVGSTSTSTATFNEKIDSGTYGAHIEALLEAKITEEKADGEKVKKAHDSGKVFSMGSILSVGNAAKGEVDKVFGSFAEGPAFDSKNLVDRFEADTELQAHEGEAVRHGDAVDRVRYFLNNLAGFQTINQQHSANPSNAAEKAIIDRCVETIATKHEADLLFINATWSAMTERKSRRVKIQRNRTGNDEKTLWKKFGTMLHEYIHVLAHPAWHKYRTEKGKSDSQGGNTLGEGVPELLTRTVITQINFNDKALRHAVLGKVHDGGDEPDLHRGYGEPYHHAMALVGVVGIHNLYAAYFLGETKLIGA